MKFQGRWFAYYGQSDTTLAVAIHDPAQPWGRVLRETADDGSAE